MDSDHYRYSPTHPAKPAGKSDNDNDSNTRLAAFQQVLEQRHSVLLTWLIPPKIAGTTTRQEGCSRRVK